MLTILSSVFRNMLWGPGVYTPLLPGRQLVLEDDEVESAEAIDSVLDFIINGTLSQNIDVRVLSSMARFLKEYDCPTVIKNLVAHLNQDKESPRVKEFILGAVLDDLQLCFEALRPPLPQWAGLLTYDNGDYGGGAGFSQFDSRTWPLQWTTMTPITYKWALDRAFIQLGALANLLDSFQVTIQIAKRIDGQSRD